MSSEHKPKKTNRIKPTMIKDVYASNFKEEMLKMSQLIEYFPFIGMDTEFPGIIYSKDNHQLRGLSNYQITKLNVDSLKVIQVGITLADKNGFYPEETCTWQFNLKFDVSNDPHQTSSIQLLMSSGIDFESHLSKGISHLSFGEYMIVSGLLLNPEVYWVTFHGIYDFAYLLRVVTNCKLPEIEKDFYDGLDLYFCNYFDLRHLIQFSDYSRGSLQKLALECNIQRIGTQHQAGSDSIVTLMAFFKIVNEVFSTTPVTNYKNILFHYVEKDDVDFDASKLPQYFGGGNYPSHFQGFRGNMHMYMYPYYNIGMNNNNLSSMNTGMSNAGVGNGMYGVVGNSLDDKRKEE